jgi:hypothetical protein
MMDRNELLGWIGVVLGIPGLLLLIAGKGSAAGAMGLLLILAFVWFYLRLNEPPFTIVEVSKVLTFRDVTGTDASMRRSQTTIANHLATEFWIRGISSDGQIENILIDGAAPDEDVLELGRHDLCKRFSHPLKPHTQFLLNVEHDLRNSFPGTREALLHRTDMPTKLIRLEVNFHSGRPLRSARLFLRYGGEEKELGRPSVNGNILAAAIKRPKIGSEYELEWEW